MGSVRNAFPLPLGQVLTKLLPTFFATVSWIVCSAPLHDACGIARPVLSLEDYQDNTCEQAQSIFSTDDDRVGPDGICHPDVQCSAPTADAQAAFWNHDREKARGPLH